MDPTNPVVRNEDVEKSKKILENEVQDSQMTKISMFAAPEVEPISSIKQETSLGGSVSLSSPKKSYHEVYGRNLKQFLENSLQEVAIKVAEKKKLENEVAELQLRIGNVKESIKLQSNFGKELNKRIDEAVNYGNVKDKDNMQLRESVDVIKVKIEAKKNTMRVGLHGLQLSYDHAKLQADTSLQELELCKKSKTVEKEHLLSEIARLEQEYQEAEDKLSSIRGKITQAKVSESIRVRMIREKAKQLHFLLNNEEPSGESSKLSKSLFSILKGSQSVKAIPNPLLKPSFSQK